MQIADFYGPFIHSLKHIDICRILCCLYIDVF